MRLPGGMEWVIVLLIVLLLFGPGRIGKIAGELGKSIKAFRDGLSRERTKIKRQTRAAILNQNKSKGSRDESLFYLNEKSVTTQAVLMQDSLN